MIMIALVAALAAILAISAHRGARDLNARIAIVVFACSVWLLVFDALLARFGAFTAVTLMGCTMITLATIVALHYLAASRS